MARRAKRMWLWSIAGVAIAAGAGYWLSRRYQVFVVKSIGGVAQNTYARGPVKWFATLEGAKKFAATQSGGMDFAGAFIADRSGMIVEGFHGTFMTGEEIDSRLSAFAKAGLELDPSVKAA